MAMINETEGTVKTVASALKANEGDVVNKVNALVNDNRNKEKEISALNEELTRLKSADALSDAVDINGLSLYVASWMALLPMRFARWATTLRLRLITIVGVLAAVNGDKASIVAVCGKEAIARALRQAISCARLLSLLAVAAAAVPIPQWQAQRIFQRLMRLSAQQLIYRFIYEIRGNRYVRFL
jgi:alanyl-tRNA synthetase